MGEYRHLLAALDLSEESDTVLQRCVGLRDGFGARLSLVHVVEYVPMAYSGDLALPEDFNLEQELLGVARQRMDAVGERVGVPAGDRHVALGVTAREVLRVVEDQGVDLIVVGSHGRHGLALLLGSTAGAILHHASCDVLAVRIAAAAP
jgi:universal stress protein A